MILASWRRFRYDRKMPFFVHLNPQITISPTSSFSANFIGNRVKDHPKPWICPFKGKPYQKASWALLTAMQESTHKGVNQRSKYVTQVQQQRPQDLRSLLLYWCYVFLALINRSLLLYWCYVFLAIINRSLLLYWCYVFRALINRSLLLYWCYVFRALINRSLLLYWCYVFRALINSLVC